MASLFTIRPDDDLECGLCLACRECEDAVEFMAAGLAPTPWEVMLLNGCDLHRTYGPAQDAPTAAADDAAGDDEPLLPCDQCDRPATGDIMGVPCCGRAACVIGIELDIAADRAEMDAWLRRPALA